MLRPQPPDLASRRQMSGEIGTIAAIKAETRGIAGSGRRHGTDAFFRSATASKTRPRSVSQRSLAGGSMRDNEVMAEQRSRHRHGIHRDAAFKH